MAEHSIRRDVRPDQWSLLAEAAEYKGMSVGTFALSVALREARNVVSEKRDFDQLQSLSERRAS